MRKLKILCSISARAGSKGIPRKNLKLLNGRPLLSYVIETALQSKLIDKVIVNTEDEIAKTTFPSLDHVTLTEASINSLHEMDRIGYRADAVLQLAPTSPFIKNTSLDQAIKTMLEYKCDSVMSLKRIEHEHPYRAKELDSNGEIQQFLKDVDVESFKQRQDLPVLYCSAGAFYLRTREVMENSSGNDLCLGDSIRGVLVDDIQAINIDRMIDFKFAEFIMSSNAVK